MAGSLPLRDQVHDVHEVHPIMSKTKEEVFNDAITKLSGNYLALARALLNVT